MTIITITQSTTLIIIISFIIPLILLSQHIRKHVNIDNINDSNTNLKQLNMKCIQIQILVIQLISLIPILLTHMHNIRTTGNNMDIIINTMHNNTNTSNTDHTNIIHIITTDTINQTHQLLL